MGLAIGPPVPEVPLGPPVAPSVADIALSAASTAQIEVRAASVRGVQHRATLQPRQDAFALEVARPDPAGEELIAVVCDGVGTFSRSHEAALLASRRLAELARDGGEWAANFAIVNDELHTPAWEGLAREGTARAQMVMATTVLAVRVRRDGERWYGRAAWVGDSPLWHLAGDGAWSPCTAEANPPPLPTANLRVAELELDVTGGALFLMSDGVGDPLASSDEVRTTLAKRWAGPPDVYDFGRQAAFVRESHEDDRTVVGLWPRP